MLYRFHTSTNPAFWSAVELSEDGDRFPKRLTKAMINFGTEGRENIQVNVHDVVLFKDRDEARRLLSVPGNTIFELEEYDRDTHAHKRHKELFPDDENAPGPKP